MVAQRAFQLYKRAIPRKGPGARIRGDRGPRARGRPQVPESRGRIAVHEDVGRRLTRVGRGGGGQNITPLETGQGRQLRLIRRKQMRVGREGRQDHEAGGQAAAARESETL